MNLVVLYGPPGVGKLTVGKALAKKTRYKLFHNHLTVDILLEFFEFESPAFHQLSREIRHRFLETAAKHGIKGVIYTFVYAKSSDDRHLRQLIRRLKPYRVKIAWVQLKCSQSELERRIQHEKRNLYKKVKSVPQLHQLQQRYNLDSAVPFKPSLVLDITKLRPTAAAQRIIKHFKL